LCKAFGNKSPDERSKIIEDNKLCLFCLLHSAEEVCYSETYKTKLVCPIPECKEWHIEWLHCVMQSLPYKKEVSLGSVNIVCECEGWRTPEDSWMELEAADEEAFFVSVLVEEEEEMEDLERRSRRRKKRNQ
jgi:hypothetical protein